MKNILLVEPAYKVKFPSLGLMKISSYHKTCGDRVKYIRGLDMFLEKPDKIYITSIFTYDVKFVREAIQFYRMRFPKAELWLGGLAATLIPDYFQNLGVDHLHLGLYEPAEDFVPDYSLHPKIRVTILLTQRGCIRKCAHCLVHIHDGPFKIKKDLDKYIIRDFEKISCWDNQFLGNPNIEEVVEILAKHNKEIDFNQSLDIRLLDERKAKLLKKLNIFPLRFAFDDISYKDEFLKGVEICKAAGLKQETRVDVLYNFKDTPEDFYERMYLTLNAGCCPYPMLYKPIDQPDKEWMSPHWTKEELKRWYLFCRSQLGRQGDFFNPRCYIYFKGKRIKMTEVFKERMFDTPKKETQRRFRKDLLSGTEEKQLL
jgi:hypothetical protein